MEADMNGPQPKPWVAGISPYVPGKAKAAAARPAIKLSANESALGASPAALAVLSGPVPAYERYPDGGATVLREAIARAQGIAPDQIVCGAGSDDILRMAAQAFAGPGDEIIGMRYGFAIYPICAARVGATYVEAADRDLAGDTDAFLACVTPRTRIVYIANPNNPTGTYLPWAEVERLHRALPAHVLLVLDAAYSEYVDQPDYDSGFALSLSAPNVLHTRTFSKIYGLPSLRIGWGTAAPAVLDALNRVRDPFNLNSLAITAGAAAIGDHAFVARARDFNRQWRDWLAGEVAALGLSPVPSICNFVLIRFPEREGVTAQAAYDYLMGEGYILRWLPGQGLPDCLRLTVGTEEENRGVMDALRRFLDSVAWRQHNRRAGS